jgi:hypothetical protein
LTPLKTVNAPPPKQKEKKERSLANNGLLHDNVAYDPPQNVTDVGVGRG